MTCPCDQRLFPPPLVIPAGLDDLPRQLAGFPEFRAEMLALIPTQPALAGWRARGDDDFGVMLLEMWAYVCDVIAFYDKVIADEAYVRTAVLRPSLRKLVGLLGYVPRPAVAATVRLGLLADGKRPAAIPAGTALRSGAFGGSPPQVFELDAETVIHPTANSFPVTPPRATTVAGGVAQLLLEADGAAAVEGDRVLVNLGTTWHVRRLARVERMTDSDGTALVRVELDQPIALASPANLATARIWKPTRSSQLFERIKNTDPLSFQDFPSTFISTSALTLDAVYSELKSFQIVLASKGEDWRARLIFAPVSVERVVAPGQTMTVGEDTVVTPDVKSRFTFFFTLGSFNTDPGPDWTSADAGELTVHFGLVDAGRIAGAAALDLSPADPIVLGDRRVGPAGPPALERFLLADDEERGVEMGAALDWTSGLLTPDPGTSWAPDLALPVVAHGNVADATRGETVPLEVLGSGNGSVPNQSFTLKKKPLTYVASPTAENDSGVASTLRVWVDGLLWTEVPGFFGQAPDAQVYVVRQKDGDESVVSFGDGASGARLPTGVDNVVASYRFGAGAASPPAGSITKIAKAAPGLRGVVNPVAAAGGADAENAEAIRTLAPRSALLLGRAVSIQDMEVAAAAAPGVVAAAAEWRWEGVRQRPVVKVWYIGEPGLEAALSQRLRALSDPSTPIDVEVAQALSPALAIDVETDPRAMADDVAGEVHAALLDPETGLLAKSRIGVGKPVFRSAIFEAVVSVPHALGVRAIHWNGSIFLVYGKSPGAGKYFDFEAGNLTVTGSPT